MVETPKDLTVRTSTQSRGRTIIEIAPLIIWLKVSWQSQIDTSGRRILKSKQEALGKSTPKRRGLEGSEASLLQRNETKEIKSRTTRKRTT
jgi:hypothetical protein